MEPGCNRQKIKLGENRLDYPVLTKQIHFSNSSCAGTYRTLHNIHRTMVFIYHCGLVVPFNYARSVRIINSGSILRQERPTLPMQFYLFIFTFVDQFVSVLLLAFLLCLAVLVLWHYLPLNSLDFLDWLLPFSFPWQAVYLFPHFLQWYPEVQVWVDALSWFLLRVMVLFHLHFFLPVFDEYSQFQMLLLFFFSHVQCCFPV